MTTAQGRPPLILPALPAEAGPLLLALGPAFTAPAFRRFALLLLAALLTAGRHAAANLLRTLRGLAQGDKTSYQRAPAHARWSGLRLACRLTRFLLRRLLPRGTAPLVGDDTVGGHKGKNVYGKARHRDPVRCSHPYTAYRYGHKWVVLAVLVRSPFATRPWALPVPADLYRSAEQDGRRCRPHRTPAQLMGRLLRLLLLWFPERPFVFVGDAGYGTHEVARSCHRRRARLTLVSKFHPKANLLEPPPPYDGKGRPLPKPHEAVADGRRRRLTAGWYGGGRRQVEVVTGRGQWYKSGRGLVPVRWVFVHDRAGAHRDEYFFTTDPSRTAADLIGRYTARWNIEATYQEARACPGLGTTRGWCKSTVLRAAPCLLGLYTAVALLYGALPGSKRGGGTDWPGKAGVTFPDALAAVRRWLWSEWVFPQAGGGAGVEKLPAELRPLIPSARAPAP